MSNLDFNFVDCAEDNETGSSDPAIKKQLGIHMLEKKMAGPNE